MLKFHQTIKGKMVIGVSVTIIILTLLMNTIIIINDRNDARKVADQYLENSLAFVSTSLAHSLWDYDKDTVEEILQSVMTSEYVASVELKDEHGTVIFGFQKPNLMAYEGYLKYGQNDVVYLDHVIGKIEIGVSSYLLEQAALDNMTRNYLFTVLTILFIIIVILYLTDNITSPLRTLEEAAHSIASGRLENDIQVKSNDEVGALAVALHSMQEQLMENRKEILDKVDQLQEKNTMIQEKNVMIESLYDEQLSMNDQLRNMVAEINSSYKITVLALANSIEANDSYTRGHCDRVRRFALLIADEMNLSDADKESLEYASVLHDIGKIGVPYSVLNKESRLTDAEFEMIKKHPTIGYEIIKDIPFLKDSAEIVLQHHERLDGLGYPYGLTKDAIKETALVLCVADAYDAMTSARPYRKEPLSYDQAMEQMRKGRDTQFDSLVVDALIRVCQKESEAGSIEK